MKTDMRQTFLPFSRPSIRQEDISGVVDVLRSGWITTGARANEFEKLFSQFVGCKGAVALSSATGGMHLLLKALDIGPGDEVITPSMTWVSTINLITLAKAKPVFVDIDRDTLMVAPETIEKSITPKTKLIIPVHFAGASLDLEPIQEIARKHKIFLVEDSAHALGTKYNNEYIGKQGTSIFSFHPIKNITTAEGGMFCSDDPDLLSRIRRLKFHGLGVDAYDRTSQGRAPEAEALEPGYKYNMTDMSASLGITQLASLEMFVQKRRELAMLYCQKLSGIEEISPLKDPVYSCKHSWHLFIVRLDIDKVKISRLEFMEELKKKNIGTGLHFKAVHLHKYYRENKKIKKSGLSNTEWNSERICSLPLFPDMTHEDVNDVVEAIKEVVYAAKRK